MANIFERFFKKRKSILVNNELTVTLVEGNQLVFHNATREMYEYTTNRDHTDRNVVDYYYKILEEQKELARQDTSKNTVYKVIENKQQEKEQRVEKQEAAQDEVRLVKEVKDGFPLLIETGDFVEEFDGAIYLKSNDRMIPLSIPSALLKKFVSLVGKINQNDEEAFDEYVALKNFWMWTSLCPNPQSREDLYGWISRNALKVNKNGFFFAYRKVVSKNGEDCKNKSINKALTEFISNSYLKVKAAKKGPKNFVVYYLPGESQVEDVEFDDEDYDYEEDRSINNPIVYHYGKLEGLNKDAVVIGNLFELHENIITDDRIDDNVDAQTYTDAHTRKMEIRLGHEVSLPADKCDWNNLQSCSNDLHIRNHVDHGCGDTTILVLVNPMNVVAVPLHDNSKMRVRAYFPVAVVTQAEDGKILNELNTIELADEYLAEQISELKTLVADNAPTELVYHRITTDLSAEALKYLAKTVENPVDTIRKRVVNG